ncbi:type II toxin-antitoxin system VapC family toxin [Candidatus Entotheonella palauensis]|uniref:Twitching motility protein PilT n=1 Tax=Candidatus Entotheonella gemina TaxID=1429439 RepID=W4LME3_9BACT|nr:type II toxin-antitoxin system VapC family toxin [Candidatus Entotheonella palauensis]ETW98855.1 MAG: twitching motility protein PilT [Candidatus Entotheonella gemina]
MGLIYLLDTNILSEPSRPHPSPSVMSQLQVYSNQVCTAAPVFHELQYGLARMPLGRRRETLTLYMERVLNQALTIFPYDRAAALWHAEERARLALQGRVPPFVDGQIAAIAVVNHLTLVTRNISDFMDFVGLTVENWFSPSED